MRNLGSLFSLIVGLFVFAGCTDDNSSIFISHVSIFEFEEGQGCNAAIDTALGRARLNVAFVDNAYVMPAVIGSQLVERDIATTAEPNGVHIEGAEVTVLNQAGQELIPAFFVPSTSGVYIPPSPVGDISRAVVSFSVIPGPAIAQLQGLVRAEGAQTIVLEVRAIGRTTGGTELESAVFNFGIELYDDPSDVICRTAENLEEYPVLNCTSGQDGLPYLTTCTI